MSQQSIHDQIGEKFVDVGGMGQVSNDELLAEIDSFEKEMPM